jgi:hypothetical protein
MWVDGYNGWVGGHCDDVPAKADYGGWSDAGAGEGRSDMSGGGDVF